MTITQEPGSRAQERRSPATAHAAVLIDILVCLALGACATSSDFHAPEVTAPAHWSDWHAGDTALALPVNEEEVTTPNSGWAAFKDPELTQLIERARVANTDLRVTLLHLAQARITEGTVSAQHGVQVNAALDAERRRDSAYGASTRVVNVIGGANPAPILKALGEPYSLYRPGFDASWELDLWGRLRRAEEAAHASVLEQAATLRQARLSLVADVARAYFTLRSLQRQLQLLQRELAARDDALQLMMARQVGGLVDESATIAAQQQRFALRALRVSLQGQEAHAMNQIAQLLDAHPGALEGELALPPQPEPDFPLPQLQAGIPSDFARRRPDILAAEARLHEATANIGVASADLYPRITLGATFGVESVGTGHLDEWAARNWSLGPSMSLPVFDHGRRSAVVTLRKLQEQEAALAYQQTVLKAWHEVDDAVTAYRAAVSEHAQLSEKAALGERERWLTEIRANGGSTSSLPNLDAQISILQIQRDLAVARAQRNVALVAVFKALGDDGEVPHDSEDNANATRERDTSR